MNHYREHAPAAWSGVACVWTQTVETPAVQRVIPDACIDIIWSARSGALIVAGPDTEPRLVPMRPGSEYTAVRFRPGTAPPVLGIPADALVNSTVPLEEVWRGRARELADRLHAGGAAAAGEILQRAAGAAPADPVIAGTVRALTGPGDVAGTAWALGLSERQLRRRCLAAFGYGPKTLQRILRFQRVLRLVRTGTPLAATAVEAGYFDQAHLAHDARRITGVTMSEFASNFSR